jgi:hypothetical protein
MQGIEPCTSCTQNKHATDAPHPVFSTRIDDRINFVKEKGNKTENMGKTENIL